jgi:hypothetical protein
MNLGQIGGGSSDTGGGGGGNPSRPMGGGKQICKFFANGQCKNGSGCRFSHELPSSRSSFGSSSTPFGVGGGFVKSNPSPFSGGGGAGGGGFGSTSNSNPFGAPRR